MPLELRSAAKARILVIDDNAERSTDLRGLLADEGFQLVEPGAGAACPIDLVIASIAPGHWPRITAAQIARISGAAPVLALIDHARWVGFDFFDIADALGAVAVLQRPFPRAALLQTIVAVLSQSGGKMAEDSRSLLQSEPTEFFLEDSHFA